MREKTFVFTNNQINTDSHTIVVNGECKYESSLGYGFVVDKEDTLQEIQNNPEVNSGFARNRDEALKEYHILTDENGSYVDSESNVPLYYKIDVVRVGNYEVTIRFCAKGEILIFAGTRRLVYRNVFDELTTKEYTFTMNVCDMIPEKGDVLYEKRSIDVSVVGKNASVQKISYRCVNCPTVYLAGDASVKDSIAYYPYSPKDSVGGWGQMLSAFMKKGVAISNHSKEEMSIEAYRQQGYFAMIKAHLRLGDYVLLHFSDMKEQNISEICYRNDLAEFVEEARVMGAYPIIVTPFCRNQWYQKKKDLNDDQDIFAEICREVGKSYHVPVIDLHRISKDYILNLGKKKAFAYFTSDGMALNDFGAYKMAEFVKRCYKETMEFVKKDAYTKLAYYFIEESRPWEAS